MQLTACPSCGAMAPDSARACPACGADLAAATAAPAASSTSVRWLSIGILVLVIVFALVVAFVQLSAAPLIADQAPIRLHIFTKADPSGFIDEMSKERAKAATELVKRFQKERGVQIVATPTDAQVLLEITSAAIVRAGERKTAAGLLLGQPIGSGNPNALVPEIRAQLTSGDYSVEMVGPSALRWKQCWNEIAAQLKTWLRDNRARLTTP